MHPLTIDNVPSVTKRGENVSSCSSGKTCNGSFAVELPKDKTHSPVLTRMDGREIVFTGGGFAPNIVARWTSWVIKTS
eukprot:2557904-Amphidinium_carterae.1